MLAPLGVLNAIGYTTDDPQQAFGLLTTLSLALVIGAFGLVRRGAIRIVALVLAGMLVAGALDQLLDRRLVDRLIVGGMLWLAVAAAYAAFVTHVPLPTAKRPRRPVLFVNPRSGGRKAERFPLADEAPQAGDRAGRAPAGGRSGHARAEGGR